MKKTLLFAGFSIMSALSAFSQDSLETKLSISASYINFSSYKINDLLASQGIPQIHNNRFGGGVSYDLLIKDWIISGTLFGANGKYTQENITTKSKLMGCELQFGHRIFGKKNFKAYSGIGLNGGTNTVSIFQDPKPTISLNSLLGSNNNLIIRNDYYNAGVFVKAFLWENSAFAPWISTGYYVPVAKTKWKADDSQITNNVRENPFQFNFTLGIQLF